MVHHVLQFYAVYIIMEFSGWGGGDGQGSNYSIIRTTSFDQNDDEPRAWKTSATQIGLYWW